MTFRSLLLQSTSNVWMTHAEMESLNAATKPPVSAALPSHLTDSPLIILKYLCPFEECCLSCLFQITLMSLSPSSSSLCIFLFLVSLWAQVIVLSIFVSPRVCCFSVNCFRLITCSLTRCSSLLSSFPAAAVTSPSFASPPSSSLPSTPLPLPSPPPPHPLRLRFALSASSSLCLFSRS